MADFACALIVHDRRLLLGQRSAHRRNRADKWDVIGGMAEADEDLHSALTRELAEEVGIVPLSQRYFATIEQQPTDSCFHYFVVDQWQGTPTIRNQEHSQLMWYLFSDAAQLPDLALPEYPDLFRRLARFSSGADPSSLG
ncbi:NUDIX domain-containing protein [Aliisedimentitalea scapharcae]|uniref:8-oxo-dGTP diphosphatase n=1 Tax=Aliisedimentitalea scapharcae TaxID=1524259 RepID=A0ABZ2XW14_9RHOB